MKAIEPAEAIISEVREFALFNDLNHPGTCNNTSNKGSYKAAPTTMLSNPPDVKSSLNKSLAIFRISMEQPLRMKSVRIFLYQHPTKLMLQL